MTINLLIACEKQQELDDLEKVVIELKNTNFDIHVYLVDFSNFTGENLKVKINLFNEIKTPNSLFNKSYFKLNLFKKIVTILYGVLILFKITRSYKITHFLYGIPIVFFRALNLIHFKKYKTFSYVRSTVVADNAQRLKLPKLIRNTLNYFKITKPYLADKFFCIDDSTTEYINKLFNSGNSDKAIKVGSIYSYNLRMERNLREYQLIENSKELKNICFLTSAFSWHNNLLASKEQVFLLNSLSKKIQKFNEKTSKKIKLLIKVHPRDFIESYKNLIENSIAIEFTELNIAELDDSYCFFSALSTMSYELDIAGFKSLYLCNNFFEHEYAEWYYKNGVKPLHVENQKLIESIFYIKSPVISFIDEDISPQKKISSYIINYV